MAAVLGTEVLHSARPRDVIVVRREKLELSSFEKIFFQIVSRELVKSWWETAGGILFSERDLKIPVEWCIRQPLQILTE